MYNFQSCIEEKMEKLTKNQISLKQRKKGTVEVVVKLTDIKQKVKCRRQCDNNDHNCIRTKFTNQK